MYSKVVDPFVPPPLQTMSSLLLCSQHSSPHVSLVIGHIMQIVYYVHTQ